MRADLAGLHRPRAGRASAKRVGPTRPRVPVRVESYDLDPRTISDDGNQPDAALAADVQAVTGQTVELGVVDQGDTGARAAADAAAHGIRWEVLKLAKAQRGFVWLPRRWVVERSCAWAARFRRLAKDDERLPTTVAGLHVVAFTCLLLHRLLTYAARSPQHARAVLRDGRHDR